MASQPPNPENPADVPVDDPIPSPEDPPIDVPSDPVIAPGVLQADEVIAPDPLANVRSNAAGLPSDADDDSDAGLPTTDHENEGWRSVPISKP